MIPTRTVPFPEQLIVLYAPAVQPRRSLVPKVLATGALAMAVALAVGCIEMTGAAVHQLFDEMFAGDGRSVLA